MLLKEIKDVFQKELRDLYPKEEIDSLFYRCVEHYLGMGRFVLVLRPQINLEKGEEAPFFAALAQLRQERPIQYIFGEAQFMGLDLKVNENVLIPRPETEELVQWILDDLKARGRPTGSSIRILDMGTGSGCMAIALAKNLPLARLTALDISPGALEVARENATRHGVDIDFREGDILQSGAGIPGEGPFDILVSNPPYVREMEKPWIKGNVKLHEPGIALFVPDQDPLLFYRAIARFAQVGLGANGLIYLEINQYLGEGSKSLLQEHNFSEIELRKDLFGNDRMVKGKKN